MTLLGVIFTGGGALLLSLGGSFYYLVAGLWLLAVAVLVWQRRPASAWVYAALTVFTIVWGIAEAGLSLWALLPRIFGPALLGLWFAVPAIRRRAGYSAVAAWAGPALLLLVVGILAAAQIVSGPRIGPAVPIALAPDAPGGTEWRNYGNDSAASRYVPVAQIDRGNVGKLQLAWSYRTGDAPPANANTPKGITFETTPLKIDDALYLCTGHSQVISLDADTGKPLWRYDPRINRKGLIAYTCRGLGYYHGTGAGLCADRLLLGTLDNRLIALDRRTGRPCRDFGNGGTVDLTTGILPANPGMYSRTSPPFVVRNTVIVGSLVFDNQSTSDPSGVARAYDVTTGKLLWAWDVLHPTASAPLAPGGAYPRDSANAWAPFVADETLGLVYVPTGNTPPDFFGGVRTPEQDRYPSSIVALDIATGNVRWSFQTVHHDVWDYDIASQPTLLDFPMPGGPVPAMLAPTKRGVIFVLDRRTGRPLTGVVERPVPQRPVKGERLSPTQPYQVGFPSLSGEDLTEAKMWGATPIDQMWCRIRYRQSRYEGQFTPPSLQGTLVYPSASGVINWGGVALDARNQIMVVNTNMIITRSQLVPRADADALGVVPYGDPPMPGRKPAAASIRVFAQKGTPYGLTLDQFLSPLNFPCNQPPWGELVGIDLRSRKIVWHHPLGTSRDNAPLGVPFPVGVFSQGGPIVTGGGLVFIGATLDNYLRAFDIANGRELWRARLPAGGQATPMTYKSFRTGRQYVVIAAGGHSTLETRTGDYVLAYALPK